MTNNGHAELWDTIELSPGKINEFYFLVEFYCYWHDQELFISRLKDLDIEIESARSYYMLIKKNIKQNPDFIRRWCRFVRAQYLGNQLHLAPKSLQCDEINELQQLIISIIKN